MPGEGLFAETIHAMFMLACRKASWHKGGTSTAAFSPTERSGPVKPVSDVDETILLMYETLIHVSWE
jgi:hypothetical protein